MLIRTGTIRSSPTDLANFLACRHKTALDLRAALGEIQRPTWQDPLAIALRERGQEHERQYVAGLRGEGLRVIDLTLPEGAHPVEDDAVAQTMAAMRDGADVIVQAALAGATAPGLRWFGYADLLRRVDGRSALGDWHYEVHDTKLTTETTGGTILQLSVYSELVATLQARPPDRFVVVTPDATHAYRFEDFAAFYRLARTSYAQFVHAPLDVYPDPTDHCEVCRWWERCNARRRQDDHLSFVAGLGQSQQAELESQDVRRLAALAAVPLPIPFKPRRGARATYERLREQARVQLEQREQCRPVYEWLPVEAGYGLCRLPEPSPGDLFLDLEGDPYARRSDGLTTGPGSAGREYLFGLGRVTADAGFIYRAWWALSDDEERTAFDELLAEMMAALAGDPDAHIFHYAPYEPSAMKRLMGRYAIREADVDALLRGGRFVDLYAVVRESLRAGVESYSIKRMEPFYGFVREVELDRAGDQRRVVELALEMGAISDLDAEVRQTVEAYNRDDVRSTLELRTWLESLRRTLVAAGTNVPRLVAKASEPPEDVGERQQRIAALRAALLARAEATEEHAARAGLNLLAFLIDWQYREDKVTWWEYYRLLGLPDEDLLDEPGAVAGLEFVEKIGDVLNKKTGRPTGSVICRYRYPPQEMDIRRGATLRQRDESVCGEVVAVDRAARILDVKGKRDRLDSHLTSAFAHEGAAPDAPARAVGRMAEYVLAHGLDPQSPYGAGVSLLSRHPPRVGDAQLSAVPRPPAESPSAFASRIAASLHRTVLPIQGPPGAGKTFTGAQMICALVRQGKRVGVTATGHKVIRGLLEAVAREARQQNLTVRLGHKPKDGDTEPDSVIATFTDNAKALAALADRTTDVLGGTAWLWSRPEFAESVDVLFVDEAGQMSLAHVLAVSQAASSLVLLGDPQQLEQPQKASHPDGVGVSAMQHVLGEHQTMPSGHGIFLPVTWRLAPAICAFTSEAFYEGRLCSKPGLDAQAIVGSPRFSGSGLRVVPVAHDGCRNASDQEVDAVDAIVAELLAPSVEWRGEAGAGGRLTPADILVVTPYNAHLGRLHERLSPTGVRVGTVDKFQGQEAPVVIYSMATSRPEDAPRGMEFLYSRHRLNVATSRAKCVCILVASPRLFEPECRTPRQMQLANALCRYREMAGN